jgi:hypothetical protein
MSNEVKATILIAIGVFVLGLAVGQFIVFSVFDVRYKTKPETVPPVEFCDQHNCLVESSAQNSEAQVLAAEFRDVGWYYEADELERVARDEGIW